MQTVLVLPKTSPRESPVIRVKYTRYLYHSLCYSYSHSLTRCRFHDIANSAARFSACRYFLVRPSPPFDKFPKYTQLFPLLACSQQGCKLYYWACSAVVVVVVVNTAWMAGTLSKLVGLGRCLLVAVPPRHRANNAHIAVCISHLAGCRRLGLGPIKNTRRGITPPLSN